MLRRVGEPVVGLAQFVRHQTSDDGVERAQRHEQNQQAAYGLQRTVDALDEYGKLEQPVQALAALRLFHAAEGQEPWVCSRPLPTVAVLADRIPVPKRGRPLFRKLELVCDRAIFAPAYSVILVACLIDIAAPVVRRLWPLD